MNSFKPTSISLHYSDQSNFKTCWLRSGFNAAYCAKISGVDKKNAARYNEEQPHNKLKVQGKAANKKEKANSHNQVNMVLHNTTY